MGLEHVFPGTRQYLDEVVRAVTTLSDRIDPFVDELYKAFLEDRMIFLIGNGGSASNASHFSQDLSKGTLLDRSLTKRFRVVSLTDNVSFLTALANDFGYESVFVQQLMAPSLPGDVLVAISVSGNSPNVLRAVEYGNEHRLRTIGITGSGGGQLARMAQLSVNVPSEDVGVVESLHSVIFHLSVSQLRHRIAESLMRNP